MTVDAVREAFRPIFLSRLDMLTVGTASQIEDHNNVFFCIFPDARPPGFNPAVCNPHTRRK
jgi:hypothetical protein